MTEQVPAKDRALNAERIARIGREINTVLHTFDADAFAADVMADLPRLELKARIARQGVTGLSLGCRDGEEEECEEKPDFPHSSLSPGRNAADAWR